MTEWVLVPREPTAKMVLAAFDAITNASGEGMICARWRCMLDAAPAAPQQAEPRDVCDVCNALTVPRNATRYDADDLKAAQVRGKIIAARLQQQAEPVAQIGWSDEFGNLFPMAAWKPAQRTHHDSHKTAWRAVYLHPPAAPQQAEPVGYFVNDESDDQWHQVDYEQRNGADTYPLYLHPPAAEVQRLRDALTALLDHYVSLVASGDAGKWDAEQEPQVIAARRALGGE